MAFSKPAMVVTGPYFFSSLMDSESTQVDDLQAVPQSLGRQSISNLQTVPHCPPPKYRPAAPPIPGDTRAPVPDQVLAFGQCDPTVGLDPVFPLRWHQPELWAKLKALDNPLVRAARNSTTKSTSTSVRPNRSSEKACRDLSDLHSTPFTKTQNDRNFMKTCRLRRSNKGAHGVKKAIDIGSAGSAAVVKKATEQERMPLSITRPPKPVRSEPLPSIYKSTISVGKGGIQASLSLRADTIRAFRGGGDFYMKPRDYLASYASALDHGPPCLPDDEDEDVDHGPCFVTCMAMGSTLAYPRECSPHDPMLADGNCIILGLKELVGMLPGMTEMLATKAVNKERSYKDVGQALRVNMTERSEVVAGRKYLLHTMKQGRPHAVAMHAEVGSIVIVDGGTQLKSTPVAVSNCMRTCSDRRKLRFIEVTVSTGPSEVSESLAGLMAGMAPKASIAPKRSYRKRSKGLETMI
jgi:hypothetical protein